VTARRILSILVTHTYQDNSGNYEVRREWEEKAMQNDDTESLSFDFQQNFPFSHLPVNEIYYMRQLWE
jgi:hypothetical protein